MTSFMMCKPVLDVEEWLGKGKREGVACTPFPRQTNIVTTFKKDLLSTLNRSYVISFVATRFPPVVCPFRGGLGLLACLVEQCYFNLEESLKRVTLLALHQSPCFASFNIAGWLPEWLLWDTWANIGSTYLWPRCVAFVPEIGETSEVGIFPHWGIGVIERLSFRTSSSTVQS